MIFRPPFSVRSRIARPFLSSTMMMPSFSVHTKHTENTPNETGNPSTTALPSSTLAKAYYDSDFVWEDHAAQILAEKRVPVFTPSSILAQKSTDLAKDSFTSWHKFHGIHMGKFFKERTYILQAFPELRYLHRLGSGTNSSSIVTHDSTPFPTTTTTSTNADSEASLPTSVPCTVLEIGCGNGSNIFPLLETYPSYTVYGTDITPTALRSLSRHSAYDHVKERLVPFLFDIVENTLPKDIPGLIISPDNENSEQRETKIEKDIGAVVSETNRSSSSSSTDFSVPSEREKRRQQLNELHQSYCKLPDLLQQGNSLHAILCTFVLSAIHPIDHAVVFHNIYRLLRPNGILCFRDYGLYDLAQLRYHTVSSSSDGNRNDNETILSTNATSSTDNGSLARLGPSWYVREGDGTFTYFFTKEEISRMATAAGFRILTLRYATVENKNRKKAITLRRVFVHGVFQKVM